MEPRNLLKTSEDILKGMKATKQEMIEKGLWNEHTTLEEWSNYAGSHCILTEKRDEEI